MNHTLFMTCVPEALDETTLYNARREPRLNYENQYEYLSGECLSNMRACLEIVAPPAVEEWGAAGQLGKESVTYLCLQYSAGVSIQALAQFYPASIWAWEEFRRHKQEWHASADFVESRSNRVPALSFADQEYGYYALPLACLGLLLGHKALMPRLCRVWDYVNEELNYFDILLENLVRPYVPGRNKVAQQYTRHLPYRKLDKVFKASPDKRPALMQKYLDEWYHASRREPYHNMDQRLSFVGYWSWESAAVTWLLGIDDSSYRHMDFYPRDLADFARQFDNSPIPADPVLSARPGQPCPRAGVWFAPHLRMKEVSMKLGEPMPSEQVGPTGGVVWYFRG